MGLKLKKIRSIVEENHKKLASDFNQKFSTSFDFTFNPEVVPDGAEDWGHSDENIVSSYKNTFFTPLEMKFSEFFEDAMYRDEINKQIKSITYSPRDGMYLETKFDGGNLDMSISVSVNQIDPSDSWTEAAMNNIAKTIESELS